MVGLGRTDDEVRQVMRDMRAHGIDMLTIGQYLAPQATTFRCAATCTRTRSRPSGPRPRTRLHARGRGGDGAIQLPRDQQAHAAFEAGAGAA